MSAAEDRAFACGVTHGRLCQEDRERLRLLEIRSERLMGAIGEMLDADSTPAVRVEAAKLLAAYVKWDAECEKRRVAREAAMTPAERINSGRYR